MLSIPSKIYVRSIMQVIRRSNPVRYPTTAKSKLHANLGCPRYMSLAYSNFGHRTPVKLLKKLKRRALLNVLAITSSGIAAWMITVNMRPRQEDKYKLHFNDTDDRRSQALVEDLDDGFEDCAGEDESSSTESSNRWWWFGKLWAMSSEQPETSNQSLDQPRKVTFRIKKINAYENRIRNFSDPDKNFRYFATIKTTNDCSLPDTILMTPSDFIRAITPNVTQPEHLQLDKYRRLNPDVDDWRALETQQEMFSKDSLFSKISPWNGLLTYRDFVFLSTILSVPPTHLKFVFRMLDKNDDGILDVPEFEYMRNLLTKTRTTGSPYTDTSVTSARDGLVNIFRERTGSYEMSMENFLEFFSDFYNELAWIEFFRKARYHEINTTIDALDFCELVLTFVFSTKQLKSEIKQRVRSSKLYFNGHRFTFDDYAVFLEFLNVLNEMERVIKLYALGLDRKILQRFVKIATKGKQLSQPTIDLLFVMFDENDDGALSSEEFFSTLRTLRNRRAANASLYSHKAEKLMAIVTACGACAKQMIADVMGRGVV